MKERIMKEINMGPQKIRNREREKEHDSELEGMSCCLGHLQDRTMSSLIS